MKPSFALEKRKRADGTEYPFWYVRLRTYEGKEIKQRVKETDRRAAEQIGRAMFKKYEADGRDALLTALEPYSSRNLCATIGAIIAAFDPASATGQWKVDPEKLAHLPQTRTVRRPAKYVQCLRLVIADALGIAHTRGAQGWREQVDALPSTILTFELVQKYFRARQLAAGMTQPDVVHPRALNSGINKTLNIARAVFSPNARDYKLRGLKLPPAEQLDEFLHCKYLPVPEHRAPEFTRADVVRMDAAAAALKVADPECWLLWCIMRRTGVSNSEALAARSSWLERRQDQISPSPHLPVSASSTWYLCVRDREEDAFYMKEKGRGRDLPLADEIMDALTGREGLLIAPAETSSGRTFSLVQRGNRFMRQFFHDHQKGLYLLRAMFLQCVQKKCSNDITREQTALELAAKAGGHAGTKVTGTHYVPKDRGIPLLTWADLQAF